LIFFGGWASPLFLFLAGVSVALAGAARVAKSGDTDAVRAAASWKLQTRGWEIFAIAHAFRFAGYLLGPGASWSSVFKPDILNILGLGLVATAILWRRATTAWRALAWFLIPAAAIVLLTPGSRVWWWPTLLWPRLEAYIRPVNNLGVFHIFPSMAYVFIGGLAGWLIARPRPDSREARFQLWWAIGGGVILAAGWFGSYLPPLDPRSDLWRTSISMIFMRTGAMALGLSAAYVWMLRPTSKHWSPIVLFGRTSLFVYLVHVQFAYGVLSAPIHHELSLWGSIGAFVALTVAMLPAAWWWSTRPDTPWIPAHMKGDVPVFHNFLRRTP
jgi:hypothetical protein